MNTRSNTILFWASFLTLIAAGMGFSIRNDIIAAWGTEFGFTQTELGKIQGMGLVGFGLTIILFSFVADRVGYGYLMIVAFTLHVFAAVSTLAAPFIASSFGKEGAYWCLYVSALSFSLANGTCEAVINPLTAKLFPNNKTHWLNILHAGWPGGLVLGALVGLLFNQFKLTGHVAWQLKWGIVLAPMLLYGAMMFARPFPRSEAHAAGISQGQMILAVLSGVLIFLFLLHALIGYVELGTDSWIIDITKTVLASPDTALMAFIWTNVLMFTLRFFAGPIVHMISPLGLLFASAVLGTLGLWMLGLDMTNTTWLWLAAVTVYGIGKTFYWPTMLGVISERFPRGGAIALGLSGGIGMISAGMLGAPLIGYKQDYSATHTLQDVAEGKETYERYKIEKPDPPPVPFLPHIAGLDNGKIGVLKDHHALKDPTKERLQIEKDLEVLREQDKKDNPDKKKENKQLEELEKRLKWWNEEGQRNSARDYPLIIDAQLKGGKQALGWTAAVPAMLAIGFLLLIGYFRAVGGYKPEVLTGHAADDEKFTGGTEGPGEG